MFIVAKTVHDSVNALSSDSEKREISLLICNFLQKLDFGKDLEKQLNFYVEARRAFINLDLVKIDLVKGVCHMAVKTQQFVKGKLNKQTSAFVRACMAYCYITIPSVELYFERLYLYALSAQVAILNQSLAQADSLFQAAIQLILDIPRTIEERDGKSYPTSTDLVHFLKYFVGVLLPVPGHPDNGPFYLLKGFVKVVNKYEWEPKSTAKITIFTSILVMLSSQYQKKLPYEWDKVENNTLLYGHTESYLAQIREFINGLLKSIREEFERLGQFADGISRRDSSYSQERR